MCHHPHDEGGREYKPKGQEEDLAKIGPKVAPGVVIASRYRRGGRKMRKTRSGSSATRGSPGMNPRARPPRTSKMGYGRPNLVASVTSTATAASSPSTSSTS